MTSAATVYRDAKGRFRKLIPSRKHNEGDTWMQSIEEIITKWWSGDGAYPGGWEHHFNQVRKDKHYPDVLESIKKRGFVRPVTCQLQGKNSYPRFSDGHHRLAAAHELGLTEIPIKAFKMYDYRSIHKDSGGRWNKNKPVPRKHIPRY